MLRVALGRARPDTEWSAKISGIEFNSDLQAAADGTGTRTGDARSRGAVSSILMIPSQDTQGGDIESIHHSQEVDPVGVDREKPELGAV